MVTITWIGLHKNIILLGLLIRQTCLLKSFLNNVIFNFEKIYRVKKKIYCINICKYK